MTIDTFPTDTYFEFKLTSGMPLLRHAFAWLHGFGILKGLSDHFASARSTTRSSRVSETISHSYPSPCSLSLLGKALSQKAGCDEGNSCVGSTDDKHGPIAS